MGKPLSRNKKQDDKESITEIEDNHQYDKSDLLHRLFRRTKVPNRRSDDIKHKMDENVQNLQFYNEDEEDDLFETDDRVQYDIKVNAMMEAASGYDGTVKVLEALRRPTGGPDCFIDPKRFNGLSGNIPARQTDVTKSTSDCTSSNAWHECRLPSVITKNISDNVRLVWENQAGRIMLGKILSNLQIFKDVKSSMESNAPPDIEIIMCGKKLLIQHIDIFQSASYQHMVPATAFLQDPLPYLPPGHWVDHLSEKLIAMVGVNVLLSVKATSKDRPKFFPGSKIVFPRFEYLQGGAIRKGRGWVSRVEISSDSCMVMCDCDKCSKVSPRYKKTTFAHFYIYTAASVVYDQLEADTTTCLFFCTTGNVFKSTANFTFEGRKLAENRSLIKYTTHDPKEVVLATEMSKLISEFQSLK